MEGVAAAVAAAVSEAAGTIYLGFSGGRDSTVLLHAAVAAGAPVVAVHVHHGLHEDAARWQRHCADIARGLGVGFQAHRVSVDSRGSLEARARNARYRVFVDLLKDPGDRLLLAHHRDDQAETVLLRLLQGRGLYGMPAARPLGSGRLIRPLLDLSGDVLARYARRHRLTWVDDPSNADERLDRNFLRHRVLPRLRRRWPDVDRSLLAAMESHRLAERQLSASLGDLAGRQSLELAELIRRPEEEGAALLRLWLQSRGHVPPGRSALDEFLRQLGEAGADRQPRLDLEGASLRLHGGRVYVVYPPPALAASYPLSLPGVTTLPHGELELQPDPAGWRSTGTVEVRFRAGGERLRRGDVHRPLKQLFQEAGVPPWERGSYPLLFDDAGLLAVPGVAARRGAEPKNGPARPAWRVAWRPDAEGAGGPRPGDR